MATQQSARSNNPSSPGSEYYLSVVRRHHMLFLVALFIGWVVVWGASWVLPPRYQSSTLILIEQPTMPKDYVKPNVNEDVQTRLQNITQQILSRTRLLQIIDELNLYPEDRKRLGPDGTVEKMRKDIDIDLIQDATKQHVTAFKVKYSAPNASIAERVTSKLTSLFINENLEVRQQQSEGTTKFLTDQVETERRNLAQQEEKIRDFKAEHVGALPSQLESNLQILVGFQSQLQSQTRGLDTAKQQQVYLQSLIREYKTAHAVSGSPESPSDSNFLEDQINKAKGELAGLRSKYQEEYPEVRAAKQHIAELEKLQQEQPASDKRGAKEKAGDANGSEQSAAALKNPQLAQLESSLHANQAEIKNDEAMVADLQSRIADYQARLNQGPIREQQLADLTRGYEQSKATYDDLLKKKNESAMATSMELLQQGEHFRIIDPPSVPIKPSFPDRMKLCGIGLVVGLALGVLLVGLLEFLDDRIYAERELKALLPVPVISEIPPIITLSSAKAERRKLWVGWATAGVVFSVILAGSTVTYLKG